MTWTSRRTLLVGSALGAAVAPLLVAPEVYAASTTRRGLYSRKRFAALKRRTFRIDTAGRSYRLRLARVRNLSPASRGDDHAFSLTFVAGRAGPGQGSYVLRRPGFRPTTLFLVPSDLGRRTYEAVVFNRP
jgi:hypothetical protein